MNGPNPLGLAELGIANSDADLLEAARSEPAILEEASARQNAQRPKRQRAGPLGGAERVKIVTETISQLKRDLYVLLVATDGLGEVSAALAQAGLDLQRLPPGPDILAAALKRDL